MEIDLAKIEKVYLAGIGGIGLSAIAYYFLSQGKIVEGSDTTKSEVTKRLEDKGVFIHYKQKADNLNNSFSLFVYTSALPEDHPELVAAKNLNIPTLSYFQFLGFLSKHYKTIAVTGTNGKTTTTALLGLILEKAGLDPTVIVGSLVPNWKSNFRFGKSDILVVEACEWQAHMLELSPQTIILTNVAEDHLDFYKDLTDIQNHFQQFIDKLPADGVFIQNKDDHNSQIIKFSGKTLTFGQDKRADYAFQDLVIKDGQQIFDVIHQEQKNNFILNIPGLYNVYNAMAALVAADILGVNQHQIWNALHDFASTWRRFEKVGLYKSNIVISDYAHHPDAVQGLLKAAHDFYPHKKIIAIFQPHHHNRTLTLLDEFAKSFILADQVIISEIYRVQGREDKEYEQVNSQDLLNKMNHPQKYYAANLDEVKNVLRDLNPMDAVLLFIGAGDIDNLARELVN
ncbi:MAG: UDP-N-acetylmuramate-L-alanine ligase [Parcubacteria group bacterium GW2011_GWA2_36_10]|nr:MAG: UDP-N-acetylmuramate-L-alanine ligase [Parcubacteria group bacterium GW2011_GWA2_36_10]